MTVRSGGSGRDWPYERRTGRGAPECLDRIYLNAYVPNLQVGGQVVSFLTAHLGYPIPSPAIFDKIGTAFRRAVGRFADTEHVPVARFSKTDRKIERMTPYILAQAATGRSGVAAIGWSRGRTGPPLQERHDRDDEQEPVPLPTIFADPADVRAAAELAEAERADARHSISPAQVAGLAAAKEVRRAEDRVAKWRAARRPPAPRPELRDDIAPDELATYCLHALSAAAALPSTDAVLRLVEVTMAGLRPPPGGRTARHPTGRGRNA